MTNNIVVKAYFIFFYMLNILIGLGLMVFNITFNNISVNVISWQSVLLVEESRVPGENHWPVTSNWQTLSHNIASETPHHEEDSNSQLKFW